MAVIENLFETKEETKEAEKKTKVVPNLFKETTKPKVVPNLFGKEDTKKIISKSVIKNSIKQQAEKSGIISEGEAMKRFVQASLLAVGKMDKDEITSFGGVARQFAIGAINSATLDAPEIIVNEAFNEAKSGSKLERRARGFGTVAGLFIGAGPANIVFKGGTKFGLTKGGKIALKQIAKEMTKKGVVSHAKNVAKLGATKAFAAGAGGVGAFELSRAAIDVVWGSKDKSVSEKLSRIPLNTVLGGLFGIAAHKFIPPMIKHIGGFFNAAKAKSAPLIKAEVGKIAETAEETAKAITSQADDLINNKQFKAARKFINENFIDDVRVSYVRKLKKAQRFNRNVQKQALRDSRLLLTEQPKAKTIGPRGKGQFIIKDNVVKDLTIEKEIVEGSAGILPDKLIKETVQSAREIKFEGLDRLPIIHSIVKKGAKFVQNSGDYIFNQGVGGRGLSKGIFNKREAVGKRVGQYLDEYQTFKGRRLTPYEKRTFVDFAEGREAPAPMQKEIMNWWNNTADDLAKEAQSLGINVNVRKNYFPHFLNNSYTSKKVRDESLKAAVDRGDFATFGEAKQAFKEWQKFLKTKRPSETLVKSLKKMNKGLTNTQIEDDLITLSQNIDNIRFGNLEMGRKLNLPFYDVDPDRVIPRYLLGAVERIEQARHLGIENANSKSSTFIDTMLNAIVKEGKDYKSAKTFIERELGINNNEILFGAKILAPLFKADPKILSNQISNKIRAFQVVTKLGLGTTVSNATQSVNTAIRTDYLSTIKGIRAGWGKTYKYAGIEMTGKEFGLRSGTTMESVMSALMAEMGSGGSGLSQAYLKYTGFRGVEGFNRIVSSVTGAKYAETLASKYAKGSSTSSKGLIKKWNMKHLASELKRLGLNPQKIKNQSGVLSLDDLITAGRKVTSETQFLTNPYDLPLPFSSPEGKILFQFKNFAFKQAKFAKDAIWKELWVNKNPRPILKALTLMPVVGEIAADFRALLDGRIKDRFRAKKIFDKSRIIENMAAVGGAGILYDAYVAAEYNRKLSFVAGPTGSDIIKMIDIATNRKSLLPSQRSQKQRKQEIAKFSARQAPFFGASARRAIIESPTKGSSSVLDMISKAFVGNETKGITWLVNYPFIATTESIKNINKKTREGFK